MHPPRHKAELRPSVPTRSSTLALQVPGKRPLKFVLILGETARLRGFG